jgi:hypothetical protein
MIFTRLAFNLSRIILNKDFFQGTGSVSKPSPVKNQPKPFLKTTPNQAISADGILDRDRFYNSGSTGRTPAPQP